MLGNYPEQVALDLDLACSLRLRRFDNERDAERWKVLLKAVAAMFGANIDDPSTIDHTAKSDVMVW